MDKGQAEAHHLPAPSRGTTEPGSLPMRRIPAFALLAALAVAASVPVSLVTTGKATAGATTKGKNTLTESGPDKNSITADPKGPNLAYAVWDQLTDFTLSPQGDGGGEPAPFALWAASLMKG